MTIISNPVVPADHIMEGVRADQIGIGIHMNVRSIGIENHSIEKVIRIRNVHAIQSHLENSTMQNALHAVSSTTKSVLAVLTLKMGNGDHSVGSTMKTVASVATETMTNAHAVISTKIVPVAVSTILNVRALILNIVNDAHIRVVAILSVTNVVSNLVVFLIENRSENQ